jgi:predicted chitinase
MQWGVAYERYAELYPALSQSLHESGCNTFDRIAMYCAQTGHESVGLLYMEEQDWNGDNYAYLEGREDLGNIYPGDGAKYHGRGPIQVTGRSNYTNCSEWAFSMDLAPSPTFFVDIPEELAQDDNGFHGVTWYWTTQRPMNDAADAHDVWLATYYINGGYNGIEDREQRYNHCMAMGDLLLVLLEPKDERPLVGEKVLSYDANIIPQETGYWCGPASAQMCLNMRGIFVEEQTLANEMGTDEGGTDYVALIEQSLDPRLPEANYSSHDAPHDPPSAPEKEAFWDALKRSIDNGYGIVMNWVAPPSNYPIGIKGSPNPSYGGGTVFHYVSAAGYDDNPSQRAVWIVDSGFQPWHYWISFDQCCSLIPPKAFCYANLPHLDSGEEPVSDNEVWIYEQLCGPIDPATGFGTGWAQLGQNEHGQNLYYVDALARNLAELEGRQAPVLDAYQAVSTRSTLDYGALALDQLAGPVTADGERHGWSQLGGRSVTDAEAYISTLLSEGEGEPPFQEDRQAEEDHPVVEAAVEGAKDLAADRLSSRLEERGQRQGRDSRRT